MLQVHKQTTLRSSRVFLNAQSFQEIFFHFFVRSNQSSCRIVLVKFSVNKMLPSHIIVYFSESTISYSTASVSAGADVSPNASSDSTAFSRTVTLELSQSILGDNSENIVQPSATAASQQTSQTINASVTGTSLCSAEVQFCSINYLRLILHLLCYIAIVSALWFKILWDKH